MQDKSTPEEFDVVIVGRGPVGATLANLLGLCGVRTLVLEREARTYHLPRAVHFDDECMRVFQTIGLAEAILPQTILSPGMLFLDADGKMLLDWSRPQTPTPMGWNLSYRFHQPDLEDVLIGGLARFAHVTLRSRCEVFALDQTSTACASATRISPTASCARSARPTSSAATARVLWFAASSAPAWTISASTSAGS